MDEKSEIVFCRTLTVGRTEKQIRVCCGDLCSAPEEYDIVICSAFKGYYAPVENTLIGELLMKKNISVAELAKDPELFARDCFISAETGTNLHRIACIELVEAGQRFDRNHTSNLVLKNTFFTMEFLLKMAQNDNIRLDSIALPILGTGNQGIELCYMASPLLKYCFSALENIEGLRTITIYDRNPEKAAYVAELLEQVFSKRERRDKKAQVFISYSSKNAEIAERICDILEKNGVPCWKAPASIPPGSNYQREIPRALSEVPIVLWIMTPESLASPWVQREIGVAIGNRCVLLPCQMDNFELDLETRFLVEGAQMIPGWSFSEPELLARLLEVVQRSAV